MKTQSAIFIFTKDRPVTLKKTLNTVLHLPYPKYIIDDSVDLNNQLLVIDICKLNPNTNYLGKAEFNRLISINNISLPQYSFLFREPGNNEWNLGYVRNFALILSKSLRLKKVLFMDDDIHVTTEDLIDGLFQQLDNYQFVGANINGLVDDSILGHVATDLGIINERMLSGGFMAFNPDTIDHFFLNHYNEDWIWLFLQLKEKKYLQTGEVYQELSDPLINFKTKLLFQEFGEIALDGILDLYKDGSYDLLSQVPFWKRMLDEREEYLNSLHNEIQKHGKTQYLEIIELVKSYSHNFDVLTFKNLFEKYSSDRILFQKLYNSFS